MPSLEQERLVLEELRRSYDILSRSSDTLDRKAGTFLAGAGLITALFGALQIQGFAKSQAIDSTVLLILALGSFLALVFLCTSALWAKAYRIPIPSDWKVLDLRLLQKPMRAALRTMISSYVEHIPFNRDLNGKKADRIRIASFLLFSLVGLSIVLGLVQAGW